MGRDLWVALGSHRDGVDLPFDRAAMICAQMIEERMICAQMIGR